MTTNYERVMKSFMPAFRLKAAQMMVNEYGIKQQNVAMFLGTTQAAISKYMKENSEKYSNIKIDKDSVHKFVEEMKAKNERKAQKIMCSMCQSNKKFDCAFMVK
jgi:predicted transcriptional regulator